MSTMSAESTGSSRRDSVTPTGTLEERTPSTVVVNVYDLTEHFLKMNQALKKVGTGLYHAGVEIYGTEYSFGGDPEAEEGQTGIFWIEPREHEVHKYRQSVVMGETSLSEEEVFDLIGDLESEWLSLEYNLLQRNCCDFSNELCKRLGVGSIPAWIKSAAGAGARVSELIMMPVTTIEQGKRSRGAEPSDGYKFGDMTRGAAALGKSVAGTVISNGKQSRGVGMDQPYQFGDLTRGTVVTVVGACREAIVDGKAARDAPPTDHYKVGDFTRGVVGKLAKR